MVPIFMTPIPIRYYKVSLIFVSQYWDLDSEGAKIDKYNECSIIIQRVDNLLTAYSIFIFLIAGTGIALLYNEIYVPAPLHIILISILVTSIYYIWKMIKKMNNKVSNRLMVLSNTSFMIMILSVLTYNHWQWERLVTNASIMKICLMQIGRASCR